MDGLRRDIASLEQLCAIATARHRKKRATACARCSRKAAVPSAYAVFSLVMENAEGVFQGIRCVPEGMPLLRKCWKPQLYDHSAYGGVRKPRPCPWNGLLLR